MSKATKIVIYALVGLAAVGLLWYFFGALAALIGGIFAGGGSKALTQYATADTKGRAEADRIELDRKAAAAEDEIKRRKAKEAIRLAAAEQATRDKAAVKKAKTREQLREMESKAADDLMRTISEPDDAGFVRPALMALLILGSLLVIAIMGSPAKGATAGDKAHTAKILRAMRAAQVKIKSLRADLKSCRSSAQRELTACQAQRANDAKACRAKIQILASKPCPPMWPHYVGAYGGAALLLGGGVALCWGLRR